MAARATQPPRPNRSATTSPGPVCCSIRAATTAGGGAGEIRSKTGSEKPGRASRGPRPVIRQMLADGRYAWPMHDPLTELATVPAVPLHPAVIATRGRRWPRSIADLLAIPDDALERRWRWLPSDIDELDVRYGLYRIHERLEIGDRGDRHRARRRRRVRRSGRTGDPGARRRWRSPAGSCTGPWPDCPARTGTPTRAAASGRSGRRSATSSAASARTAGTTRGS